MAKLQRPPYAYMNGRVVDWDDARIHIGSEALIRGISVFEGIKGYWRDDGSEMRLLALREHYDRLCRSTALQALPFTMPFDEFQSACFALVQALMTDERDLWLRPTVFAVEGHWGEDTVTDLVITCYHQDKKKPTPIEIGFSTWQRPLDNALPARIKSAANYQISRLARIEGRRQGFDDMLLFNAWGRIAEATGSCLVMVRNGKICTPPPYEGCLESITINIIEGLANSLGIPFERRPIERTELLVADELALAGTLMELGIVKRLDGRMMPRETPVIDQLAREYWACVRGANDNDAVNLTPVPGGAIQSQ